MCPTRLRHTTPGQLFTWSVSCASTSTHCPPFGLVLDVTWHSFCMWVPAAVHTAEDLFLRDPNADDHRSVPWGGLRGRRSDLLHVVNAANLEARLRDISCSTVLQESQVKTRRHSGCEGPSSLSSRDVGPSPSQGHQPLPEWRCQGPVVLTLSSVRRWIESWYRMLLLALASTRSNTRNALDSCFGLHEQQFLSRSPLWRELECGMWSFRRAFLVYKDSRGVLIHTRRWHISMMHKMRHDGTKALCESWKAFVPV